MTTELATVTQLQEVELFHGISASELQPLVDICHEETYPVGSIVFHANEIKQSLFIVLEGAVELTLAVPGFDETVIAVIGANDVFGECSFFHAAPHLATATCQTEVRLLELSREGFDRLLASGNPAALRLGMNAAQILAARLQLTDHWLGELMHLLREKEVHEVSEAWRRYRERIGMSFATPQGFIHTPHAPEV
jgi:CRP-like cAMP-binding protein